MNEQRLSRMERHGRGRSGKMSKDDDSTTNIMDNTEVYSSNEYSINEDVFNLGTKKQKQSATQNVNTLDDMPSRRELFPSQRLKLTRWFFNSLVIIFVAIMIALLWWGISDSPWGQYYNNVG